MRAAAPPELTGRGKDPWQWQRSSDGGPTPHYTPVASDVGNCLRACASLNETAPEGLTEACVHMFAKTQAAPSG